MPRAMPCLLLSHVRLFCSPMDQAPLFMEFSRQEYWNRLTYPYPGDILDPGIELVSLVSRTGKRILYHCHLSEFFTPCPIPRELIFNL